MTLVMALVAMTFTACCNKTDKNCCGEDSCANECAEKVECPEAAPAAAAVEAEAEEAQKTVKETAKEAANEVADAAVEKGKAETNKAIEAGADAAKKKLGL